MGLHKDAENDEMTTDLGSCHKTSKAMTDFVRRVGNKSQDNDPTIKYILASYLQHRRRRRNGTRLDAFLDLNPQISRATLYRWLSDSGISAYLNYHDDMDERTFHEVTDKWLETKYNSHQYNCHKLGSDNRIFTDDEEGCMVNHLKNLGDAGHGCTNIDFAKMAADCMSYKPEDTNEPHVIIPSRKLLNSIKSRHPECALNLRAPKMLDDARARQANEDVRDVHFMKIEQLVIRLYEAGIAPWSSPSEIPPECIYNMDEVGLDTAKGNDKIYISTSKNSSLQTNSFLRTKEGDKMSRHITLCLATCANGKILFFSVWSTYLKSHL